MAVGPYHLQRVSRLEVGEVAEDCRSRRQPVVAIDHRVTRRTWHGTSIEPPDGVETAWGRHRLLRIHPARFDGRLDPGACDDQATGRALHALRAHGSEDAGPHRPVAGHTEIQVHRL